MNSRDEQLEALEAALETAERKMRKAEKSAKDISDKLKKSELSVEEIAEKLKSTDEEFQKKFEKAAKGYAAQTGADLQREQMVEYDDDTLFKFMFSSKKNVKYHFTRQTTEQERKKRRKLVLKRTIDSNTGKPTVKPEIADSDNQTVNVSSAKDLKKPSDRKRFVAYKFFGYRKLDISTDVNPFFKVVGAPIVVPAQTAVKIAQTVYNSAAVQKTSAAVKGTAKVITAPIVIPAKIIKDINDKGGVIHSIVDLGDKIRIEGIKTPLGAMKVPEKPPVVSQVSNIGMGVVLGTETAAVNTVKEIGSFTVEIAKEKIYEEINSAISENDAAKAAYVIGMKAIEVYAILDKHDKFRRAVRRDKAGKDITDVAVSKYLADKDERKYRWERLLLRNKQRYSEFCDKIATVFADVEGARNEYNSAKNRLEQYRAKKSGIVIPAEPVEDNLPEEETVSKVDKKITKTKKKINSLRNTAEKNEPPVATGVQTAKNLDSLAVTTSLTSLRRKAMRDCDGNTGVEAADFAVTAYRTTSRYAKILYDEKISLKTKHYEGKLQKLENQKELEKQEEAIAEKLHERKTNQAEVKKSSDRKSAKSSDSKSSKRRKTDSAKQHEAQKQGIKKKHHVKAHKEYVRKEAAKEAANSVKALVGGTFSALSPILIMLIVAIMLMILMIGAVGGGTTAVISSANSPCSTNDLGRCDRYYTELGKNLIEQYRNIRNTFVGYDKYTDITEIDRISHSPEELLPYLAVKTLSESGKSKWTYNQAKPYIEEVFNEQYELVVNEGHEVRKDVRTVEYMEGGHTFYPVGTTTYDLKRPYGADIPNPLTSDGYACYAPDLQVTCFDGYITNTMYGVGKSTDKDGNLTVYDDMQDITYYNYWSISLVYYWDDDDEIYREAWVYREEKQEYTDYDYNTIEYGIRENTIYSDGGYNGNDNNFDRLIYNKLHELDSSARSQYAIYYQFRMGHQFLTLPFKNPVITKYAGYDNSLSGDLSLDYSLELQTYAGQEIICGMDGKVTKIDDKSFSVYNKDYGTLFYDYVEVPNKRKAEKGKVVTKAQGGTLRITFVDTKGNYLNPLFLFS